MPLPEDLQIQRDLQRRTVGRFGTVNQPLHKSAVTQHIHLEHKRVPVGSGGHVFQRANAHGGQSERNAKGLGRPRAQNLTICVLHAREARGRNGHGHGHFLAQHRGFSATSFHVDGHTLAQFDALKISLVGAVGALGPTAAVSVVVEHFWHPALGHLAQVFDTGDFG